MTLSRSHQNGTAARPPVARPPVGRPPEPSSGTARASGPARAKTARQSAVLPATLASKTVLASALPSKSAVQSKPALQKRLGKVLDFMRVMWAVDHGLQTMSKRMETDLGITGMQRFVIRIVGRFPGISAGELAEVLHVHPSTLTGVLKRLEKRAILERRPAPQDARRAMFFLRPMGRDLDALQAGTTEAAVRRAVSRVSAKDLELAELVLAKVANELAGTDIMR